MRRCLVLLSLIAGMALRGCIPATAASIENLAVSPDRATANSTYAFSFVWQDDEGRAPNSLQIQFGDNEPIVLYYADGDGNPQPGLLDPSGGPLVISDGKPANEGTTYFIRATAGLHFVLEEVDPIAGRRIHPQDPSLIYLPYLSAEDNGAPKALRFEARGTLITPPEEEGGEVEIENIASEDDDEPSFTIYNTFRFNAFIVPQSRAAWRDIYAGKAADSPPYYGVDTVSGYSSYPDPLDSDPLNTIGPRAPSGNVSPDNEFEPDDGASSTAYVFKVAYSNAGNLPPQQWLPPIAFGGVVPDRRGVFWSMGLTAEESAMVRNNDAGVVLFITRADVEDSEYVALPMRKENPDDNDYTDGVIYRYVFGPSSRSLANGIYKYFFATSDDYIRDAGGALPDWLDVSPYVTGDVIGNAGNLRLLGVWNEDLEIYEPVPPYVDRPAHQPGETSSYFYSALEHPEVTLGLDGPNASHFLLYMASLPDSSSDGTVRPVRTNAIQPDTGSPGPMATSDTELNFQIEYSQLFGVAPEAGSGGEISVYIDPGTASERRFTLVPTDVLGSNIVDGVMYQTPTPVDLTPGRHAYRFTAGDGRKRAFYPVSYSDETGPQITTRSLYINNRPQLSEVTAGGGTVTPALGTAGDNFRFMIRYTDADNQKPYRADLWVKYGDGPDDYERVQMYKLDPTDTNYVDGCVYIYDSANLMHKLQPGWRGHYFEFMDDWGWREDPHSRIPGETVYYPGPNFVNGPYITTNQRPRLTQGVVLAEDGTSNPATLWSYKVRYTDADNHAPAYVNLYIGKAAKDSEGNITDIVWDYGNPMVATNPSDTVYSDGKDYAYSTRLDSLEPGDTFFYTFVASDGIDVALYDATTSPSTGSVYDPQVKPPFEEGGYPAGIERIEPEEGSDGMLFQTTHYPLVGEIPLTPINKLYRYPLVYDSNGFALSYLGGGYTVDFVNGLIGLTEPSDYIDVQYWFATEGPVVQNANTPPTLESGRVMPDPGTSSDIFTFSVIYKDPDGRFGQAPSYIRAIVDGQPTNMTPTSGGGLDYRSGVRYEALMSLSLGAHQYYFEASDGSAYAIFDKNGGRSSSDVILDHTPIPGPYVNDLPTLTEATVFPRGVITIAQGVIYSVIYTDSSNEPPDAGYPVVFIDNPTEIDRSGTISAISGPVITVDGVNWQANEFAGMPVEITSAGLIYRIESNTANTLTVVASDVYGDGARVGHTLQIGRLSMMKSDPSDNNYTDGVLYQAQVPSLGAGLHTAHFRVRTTEVIGPDGLTRVSSIREPALISEEIQGPTVLDSAPPGNEPPVLLSASVMPTSGLATDTFSFAVTYRDPDGDAPEYRSSEGVRGYVRLIIDNTTVYTMDPPALPNYVTGAIMTADVSGLPGGMHRYHFEASDGYHVVRLPASISQFYTFGINRRPVLSEPDVSPAKGNLGRPFTYSVIYTDLDGNAPQTIRLHIDGDTEGIEIKSYAVMPPGSQYRDGILYAYTLPAGTLAADQQHTFYFTANDGLEDAVPTEVIVGPTVHTNLEPTLDQGIVLPAEGWNTDTFTYTVRYSDPNGDEPEYVRVYIDGSSEANARLMTKVGDSDDFEAGVVYTFQTTGLAPGTHTYFFEASDWMDVVTDPASGVKTGPTVTQKPTATITIQASSNPRVGQPLTISGAISPAMAVSLTLRITQPNGTILTRTLVSQANGSYSYTFTPHLSGVWKATVSWVGNANYAASISRELQVAVEGPTFTVSGLHMISVPLNLSNAYPDGAFGPTPPFALAKWSPSQALYKFHSLLPGYGTDFDFPLITAGQSYWMKTLQPKVLAPSGTPVTTATHTVTLATGWTQVGNPFLADVTWSNLQIRYNGQTMSLATAHANGLVREYGWTYDPGIGNYKLVDATRPNAERVMRTWLGYWMKALVDCQLVIPNPAGGSEEPPPPPPSPTVMAESSSGVAEAAGFDVVLSASNGELRDEAQIGFDSAVAEKIESPTCLERFVDVFVTDDNGSVFAHDIRSGMTHGENWQIGVVTDEPGQVVLNWSGLDRIPRNVRLTLVDEDTGQSVVMSPGGSHTFDSSGYTSKTFRIRLEKTK